MEITAILVTFNRLECLKLALKKFEEQTFLPKRLVIINNKSTDGTFEFLKTWKKEPSRFEKVVVNSEINRGGAGGFALGLSLAKDYTDTDWIWLTDDDAYLKENTFKNMHKIYSSKLKDKNVAALFTSVINKNEYDLSHRRIVKPGLTGVRFLPVSAVEYEKDYFQLTQGSYVGMLVRTEMIKLHGGTREDFFIYYDDTEHSERLNKFGNLYCIPSAEVVHDVDVQFTPSWKDYYAARNSTILINNTYGKYFAILNVVKRYIKSFNKSKPSSVRKMERTGLIDGLRGKTGLHEVYKPGWKVD